MFKWGSIILSGCRYGLQRDFAHPPPPSFSLLIPLPLSSHRSSIRVTTRKTIQNSWNSSLLQPPRSYIHRLCSEAEGILYRRTSFVGSLTVCRNLVFYSNIKTQWKLSPGFTIKFSKFKSYYFRIKTTTKNTLGDRESPKSKPQTWIYHFKQINYVRDWEISVIDYVPGHSRLCILKTWNGTLTNKTTGSLSHTVAYVK